jgi:hypothetical protein
MRHMWMPSCDTENKPTKQTKNPVIPRVYSEVRFLPNLPLIFLLIKNLRRGAKKGPVAPSAAMP